MCQKKIAKRPYVTFHDPFFVFFERCRRTNVLNNKHQVKRNLGFEKNLKPYIIYIFRTKFYLFTKTQRLNITVTSTHF